MKTPRTPPYPLTYQHFWRIMGLFVAFLSVGVWGLSTAFTHEPRRWYVMAPLGAVLVVGSPLALVAAIRVFRIIRADRRRDEDGAPWTANREVAAAAQSRPPDGVAHLGARNRVPAWRLLLALAIFAGLVVGGVVRSDHPIAGLIIVLAVLAMAVPVIPGLVRVLHRR